MTYSIIFFCKGVKRFWEVTHFMQGEVLAAKAQAGVAQEEVAAHQIVVLEQALLLKGCLMAAK